MTRLAAVSAHVSSRPAAAVNTDDPAPTVGLLGLPNDMNSTFLRGPATAPQALRVALACDSSNSYAELGDSFTEIVHDCGDAVLLVDATPTDADARLEAAVAAVLRRGLAPLLVGGDHSVTYPAFRALAAHFKATMPLPSDVEPKRLAIVHFDAHPDLYEDVGTFMPEVII